MADWSFWIPLFFASMMVTVLSVILTGALSDYDWLDVGRVLWRYRGQMLFAVFFCFYCLWLFRMSYCLWCILGSCVETVHAMECPAIANLDHVELGDYYVLQIGTNYLKESIPFFYFPHCMISFLFFFVSFLSFGSILFHLISFCFVSFHFVLMISLALARFRNTVAPSCQCNT
jgi:hypothetical protein